MELAAAEEPPHILVKQEPEADKISWPVPSAPLMPAGPQYQRFHNSPQTALPARTQAFKTTSLWGIISDLTHNNTGGFRVCFSNQLPSDANAAGP